MDKVEALGLQPGHLESYRGGWRAALEGLQGLAAEGLCWLSFLWKPGQGSLVNITGRGLFAGVLFGLPQGPSGLWTPCLHPHPGQVTSCISV